MSSSDDDTSASIVFLEKLTYGGDAMGRLEDGRAIFVPFGLPGERVRVRLKEEKRGFARGKLVEVLEPSPQRIASDLSLSESSPRSISAAGRVAAEEDEPLPPIRKT